MARFGLQKGNFRAIYVKDRAKNNGLAENQSPTTRCPKNATVRPQCRQ